MTWGKSVVSDIMPHTESGLIEGPFMTLLDEASRTLHVFEHRVPG